MYSMMMYTRIYMYSVMMHTRIYMYSVMMHTRIYMYSVMMHTRIYMYSVMMHTRIYVQCDDAYMYINMSSLPKTEVTSLPQFIRCTAYVLYVSYKTALGFLS